MTDAQLTLLDRASALVVKCAARLPGRVQNLLTRGPLELDGTQLSPEVHLLMRLVQLAPQPAERDVALMRVQTVKNAALFGGRPLPVDSVTDVDLPDGIPARLYRNDGNGPAPLLVYTHGGGWVCGGLESADSVCRFLAKHAGISVLSVSYRLAPEHPFPAATDDAYAAYRHVRLNADAFGADPQRIAVGGDSAGGNLAAVTAQRAKRDGFPVPVGQLLLYPATNVSTQSASYDLFSDGFLLTRDEMAWCIEQYLPRRENRLDPRASPLLSDDLSGLPPTILAVAGFDVLRDEGIAYANALNQAGVPVTLQVNDGIVHAFANTTGIGKTGTTAMLAAANALRLQLAATKPIAVQPS